jgi:hypothetical protein
MTIGAKFSNFLVSFDILTFDQKKQTNFEFFFQKIQILKVNHLGNSL